MIDDSDFAKSSQAATGDSADASTPVGYCQECGRPLVPATLRRVNNGVFCAPCASSRQHAAGWQAVHGAYPGGAMPGGSVPGLAPHVTGQPNPVLAAILGFIPGVGAMYNAQYAKGALHLIVFVVLVTLADNLNSVFYWLVWGWIFYQAFDAYHTARARRDGMALPNPFGWNDIGDRLGLNRTSPPPPPPASFTSMGYAGAAHTQTPTQDAGFAAAAGPAQSRYPYAEAPRPVTDNPYTAPYSPMPTPPVPPAPAPPTSVPYVPTYTGTVSGQSVSVLAAVTPSRRFPVGALWLIGLGILFLMGNLLPEWRLSGRWLVPVLLAAVAAFSAVRRWEQFRTASVTLGASPNLPGAMIGPAVLLTVAMLLVLQAGEVVELRRSWPVLLVVWGGMLLLQRTASYGVPALPPAEVSQAAPPPVRSTSGTGSLGL